MAQFRGTRSIGEHASEVVHPIRDLHVTMLRLMGLDDNKLTYFHGGRFKQLSQTGGQPIAELMGCGSLASNYTPIPSLFRAFRNPLLQKKPRSKGESASPPTHQKRKNRQSQEQRPRRLRNRGEKVLDERAVGVAQGGVKNDHLAHVADQIVATRAV